jgi:hypothetical protein
MIMKLSKFSLIHTNTTSLIKLLIIFLDQKYNKNNAHPFYTSYLLKKSRWIIRGVY